MLQSKGLPYSPSPRLLAAAATSAAGHLHALVELPDVGADQQTKIVTTGLLGKARIPDLSYLNPDGTLLKIDTDYFGKTRNKQDTSAGPFEDPGNGKLSLKVWQGKR